MIRSILRGAFALMLALGIGAGAAGIGVAAAEAQEKWTVTATTEADDSTLSGFGNKAIEDVRRCIASNSVLDVYYLIDASGSLFKSDEAGAEQTDPDFVRADILANSLKQLANLDENVAVNFSAGFFGTDFKHAIGWTEVTAETAAEQADLLDQTIRDQPTLGWTNWEDGIDQASKALADQQKNTQGCQLLVWLTDGGINTGQAGETAASLNTLCGRAVEGTSEPTEGLGAFNALRKDGVVVVGVLLRVNPVAAEARMMQYMRPLVESQGQVDGKNVTCGQSPPPNTHANGVLVEASDTGELARVFAHLGALIGGGYPAPFAADGSFQIDPGVSRFTVVVSGRDWKLNPPVGSNREPNNAGTDQPGVSTIDSVAQIDVDVTDKSLQGRWMLSGAEMGDPKLYLYSDLQILPDENSVLAGTPSSLTGRIAVSPGHLAVLSDYQFNLVAAKLPHDGSEAEPIGERVEVDLDKGTFTVDFSADETDGGIIRLIYSLENLKTAQSGSDLADVVSAATDVAVSVPKSYPTISPTALTLSALEGANGIAEGKLTLTSPADESAGRICFPEGLIPTIGDPQDRPGTWVWDISGVGDDSCVSLAANESAQVSLAVQNSVAADSSVVATLPVSLFTAEGKAIEQTLPIAFETTRPISVGLISWIVLAMVIAGIALSFGILYLINFLTSKIAYGKSLLRASFPVVLSQDAGVVGVNGFDLTTASLDQFNNQAPREDARSFDDPDLGKLRTRTGLGEPRFEIIPKSGMRVITASRSHARRAVESGRMGAFDGQMNSLWAFLVTEQELRDAPAIGPVRGTLVVYKRNDPARSGQFLERMIEVSSNPQLWKNLARARATLTADDAERSKKTVVSQERPASAGVPKSPSSSAEPPRGGDHGPPPPPPRVSGTGHTASGSPRSGTDIPPPPPPPRR